MPDTPLVLLVGHCMPDSFGLSRFVSKAIPDAATKRVNSTRAMEKHIGDASLLLVNRALDGRFGTESGVELIASLRERPGAPPMMLVSNYADAQERAVAHGALPGVGKSNLSDEESLQRVRRAAAAGAPDA